MRVLHVLGELKPSGAEVMLAVSASEWSKVGVKNMVLSTGRVRGIYAEQLEAVGYSVSHLPFERSLSCFVRFYDFLRRMNPDVVVVHPERASFWYLVTALACGIKVVRVVHAIFGFKGWLRISRSAQRRILAKCGVRYVAISESVLESERKYFRLDCSLIYNWIDTRRFRPPTVREREMARSTLGLQDDSVVIVSVGNCSKIKNHSEFIRALSLMSWHLNWMYLHVGVEDADQSERKLATELGVSDRIIFAGWVADPRVALWAGDFFVMPSLHEGLGNAAIEALATGLPSLFTDVPGLRDFRARFPLIRYSGVSSDSLAEQLVGLLNERPDSSRCCSVDQLKTVNEMFSVERGVKGYLCLFRELINGQSVASSKGN